jgi:hypothetical protein
VAQRLPRLAFGLALLAPVFGDRALGRGTAGCGGDQPPARWHAPIRHGLGVLTRAVSPRPPRCGESGRQGGRGCGQGGRHTGDPWRPGVRQWLEVLFTGERAVGHPGRRPLGGLELAKGRGADRPTVTRLTGMTTEGLQQHGNPRVVFPPQVPPHVAQVRPMIAAVAARTVQDGLSRRRVTGVAPIDTEAGAIQRGKRWCEPHAWHGHGRTEAVARCHPGRLERLPGASQRLLMAMRGFKPWGEEARRGLMLTAHRHQRALLLHNAQPIEAPGVDSTAHGHQPRRWVVLPRPGKLLAKAQCVRHSGPKTSMVQDVATVQSRQSRLLA